MHIRTRSQRNATSSGLCDRPRRRPGSGAQPPASSAAGIASAEFPRSTGRFIFSGGRSGRRTTIIQRTDVRSHELDGPGHRSFVLGTDSHGCELAPQYAVTASTLNRRLVGAVKWYQHQAEGRPSPCRFTPSCSWYALEALESYGTLRGLWLTLRRLLRCRPFGPSGFDPVPEVFPEKVT